MHRFPPQAVAFEPGIASRDGGHVYEEVRGTIRSEPGDNRMTVLTPDVDMMVRRLTPKECERLQGLPDDHTLVPYRGKPMADGPRYMMVGNGISINTLSWIGAETGPVSQGGGEAERRPTMKRDVEVTATVGRTIADHYCGRPALVKDDPAASIDGEGDTGEG